MPLRKRISAAAAAAVAGVLAIALIACYIVVRDQQLSQINHELEAEGQLIATTGDVRAALTQGIPGLPAGEGGPTPYFQIVTAGGQSQHLGSLALPDIGTATAVAAGRHTNYLTDVRVGGAHLAMYTIRVNLTDGGTAAFQLARPLAAIDNVLSKLRLVLALIFLVGVGLAALLGRIAARRVLRPLAEVTNTAELIGETDDLGRRLNVHGDDEVGQLASRFNAMLDRLEASRAALDDSVRSQRQLVADASHELRTPVTSLRTNVEVLLEGGAMDEEDRRRLMLDVVEQSEELSTLVNDLIEVARGQLPDEELDELRLDQLVEASLARARRNAPDVPYLARLEPVVVSGNPERLSRAVNNLLDNAARHGRGGPVEVSVDSRGVTVRDHGGGIGEEDLPHVFDRFYRGANSRATQGSGLGLAIVRQVATLHDGSVTAANAPDGGATFTFHLPTLDPDDREAADGGPEAAEQSSQAVTPTAAG